MKCVPNSRFIKMYKGERYSTSEPAKSDIPNAPVILGQQEQSVDSLIAAMQLTDKERDIISEVTLLQSFSPTWSGHNCFRE